MPEMQEAAGQPPGVGAGDGKAAGSEFVTRFGLPAATALVVGSVIGDWVFAFPSALAPHGPSSLVASYWSLSARWR